MQNLYSDPYLGLKLHNHESKERQENARRANEGRTYRQTARMLRQPMAAEPLTGSSILKQA